MGFKDYSTAAAMRDVMVKIAEEVVNRMRPDLMIGEVYSFDTQGTAQIRLPGHSADELLQVRFAKDKQPVSSVENPITGVADVVRIAGKPGSWFILDFVRGQPGFGVPTGVMLNYGGQIPPDGFLFCDGSFLAIEEYPVLFSVIGHNNNRVSGVITDPGDGTFKLPDFRRRTFVGAVDFDTDSLYSVGMNDERAVGSRAGTHSHTHNHSISPANLNLETNTATTPGGGNRITNGENHTHGNNTGSSDVAASDYSRHAYQSAFVIIKT